MNWKQKEKEHLLQSGLPLEHLLATRLAERGYIVHGEFSYIRTDRERNERSCHKFRLLRRRHWQA